MRTAAAILLLVATAAAAQLPERYTFEPGFDRPGGDYESFEQTGEWQSHELCRDACYSQPKCKSYTFVKPGVAGAKALCRLKDREPPPVEDDCCISAVKGGRPKLAAIPSLKLRWLGWDADELGKDRDASPDGAPDHRFLLEIDLPPEQALEAVTLRPSDAHGVVTDPLRWSSQGSDAQLLVVELDGRRLGAPGGGSLGLSGRRLGLDLYAHDIGQWDIGRHVIVEARLRNGKALTHWFELEPPPDRLLGTWQMHCPNKAPHRFEPWTLSGRLQLGLREDGSIGGFFGAMPLTGARGADGAVRGSAASGTESVEWSGKLERVERGKPLRGSGTFRFVRSKDACTAAGTWSAR